jgi:hypothetical protein
MMVFDETAQDFKSLSITFETLAQAQSLTCIAIKKYATILRAQFLDPTSPYEASSWPIKQAEAKKVVDGGASIMIEAEAFTRGITAAALANKVLSKATAFAALEATIAGTTGKHCDIIKTLSTIEDVDRYDWSDGWV